MEPEDASVHPGLWAFALEDAQEDHLLMKGNEPWEPFLIALTVLGGPYDLSSKSGHMSECKESGVNKRQGQLI